MVKDKEVEEEFNRIVKKNPGIAKSLLEKHLYDNFISFNFKKEDINAIIENLLPQYEMILLGKNYYIFSNEQFNSFFEIYYREGKQELIKKIKKQGIEPRNEKDFDVFVTYLIARVERKFERQTLRKEKKEKISPEKNLLIILNKKIEENRDNIISDILQELKSVLKSVIFDQKENIEELLDIYVKKIKNMNIELTCEIERMAHDIELKVKNVDHEKGDSAPNNKTFYTLSINLSNPTVKITVNKKITRGYTNELDSFFNKIKK